MGVRGWSECECVHGMSARVEWVRVGVTVESLECFHASDDVVLAPRPVGARAVSGEGMGDGG